jgi:hypothetical protein
MEGAAFTVEWIAAVGRYGLGYPAQRFLPSRGRTVRREADSRAEPKDVVPGSAQSLIVACAGVR